jgi:hypothetical protein
MNATETGVRPCLGLHERRAHLLQTLAALAPASSGAVAHEAALRDTLGFVPPCSGPTSAAAVESSLRALHERLRTGGLRPEALDAKSMHLLLTALLLVEHGAAAVAQGLAARRAGASLSEVEAVVALAFATHGLAGLQRGDEFLAALAAREQLDLVKGAVAAYG